MATFKGEDAKEMADRYAEVAHNHELFDGDKINGYNEAISKYLNTLKQFSDEELGKIEFGDGKTQLEGAE